MTNVGETAYRPGAMDGIKYGMEQKAEGKDTILSLEDMVHIIYIYDAVKKIHDIILGKNEIYDGRKGILGTLSRICDLAYNGTLYNIKLLGEDEADNTIFGFACGCVGMGKQFLSSVCKSSGTCHSPFCTFSLVLWKPAAEGYRGYCFYWSRYFGGTSRFYTFAGTPVQSARWGNVQILFCCGTGGNYEMWCHLSFL